MLEQQLKRVGPFGVTETHPTNTNKTLLKRHLDQFFVRIVNNRHACCMEDSLLENSKASAHLDSCPVHLLLEYYLHNQNIPKDNHLEIDPNRHWHNLEHERFHGRRAQFLLRNRDYENPHRNKCYCQR